MPATFETAPIEGLVIVRPRLFFDERGFFLESYKRSEYRNVGIAADFVQDNHSRSAKGVLRGLHYQVPPYGQGKLVRVVKGRALDVAVDIREGSATFGKHFALLLDDESCTMLYVPPGFAHGFLALAEEVHLLYKCTAEYSTDAERGIRWNDPRLAIPWPIEHPTLSDKDASLPSLAEAEPFREPRA